MLKYNKVPQIILILIIFLNSKAAFSQDTVNPFQIKLFDNPLLNERYNKAPYLQLPQTFTNEVTYDPVTGQMLITPKLGNIKLSNPFMMNFEQYNKYKNQQFLSNTWKSYSQKSEDANPLSNFLNPQINLGIKGMDKIFGSDQITVTPTGNIDISLGYIYYNNHNVSLSKQQRQYTNFDFNQDIQVGINGKVGDKLNLGININTQSMFDFENQKKIEYNGQEDEIIQKIEAGDVSFPVNNSLIPGSSTLFGIKTDLKFGNLIVSTVLSQQKGQSKTIEIQGSAVQNDFEISAGDYEEDQHFFLNHYFRDNYEKALSNLPVVTSSINITKIEIWVTNKTSDFQNARNIIGFMDLGESDKYIYADNFITANPAEQYPSNKTNNLYNNLTTTYSGIRDISQVSSILSIIPDISEGTDYCKLESARKLSENDYSVNTTLGYISLRYQLRPGEILAVAYEYSVNGKTYKVGEFSTDVEAPKTLILKLLRGPASNPQLPSWDLMMKNIYSLSTSNVNPEDFVFDIYYNNDRVGTKINYIPDGDINNQRLLSVMNFDNTDNQLNQNPDGFFDFINGITIDSKNGLIIFPELEPFGSYLANKINNTQIAQQYSFPELYDSTQYIAHQKASKNKFFFKGHFKSSSGSEIMLNAYNIPKNSVTVTQGGNKLTENVDYSVDYNIGKVTIINQSLLSSGIPIKISLESNDTWGMTTKTLIGANLIYQISNDFNIGATFEHMSEMPAENKTSFGFEPISNSIYGFNVDYSHDAHFLTKLVDALPFIQTKAPSKIIFSAEFAQLIPHFPVYIKRQYGVNGVTFIDPFEYSQTYIDLTNPSSWSLSSIPQGQTTLFPEASNHVSTESCFNRAKIAWYEIPSEFFDIGSPSYPLPSYITKNNLSNHYVRPIYEKEIFPHKETEILTPARISLINIAYFPSEKGPYNFDITGVPGISSGQNSNGKLNNPESRWGGIMRSLYITDFESSNIGFIEFWLLDPFIYDKNNSGDMYIDLGDISEDILLDGRKSFENGLPANPTQNQIDTTQWGIVSNIQTPTQTFDNNIIIKQDVGLDGLNNVSERTLFFQYIQDVAQTFGINSIAYQNAINDPANDDFRFYTGTYYTQKDTAIVERFKNINNPEGNSTNFDVTSSTQAYTLLPDKEDINSDNTLDNYEAYYQYHIKLDPNHMEVGQNYIVNKVEATALSLINEVQNQKVTWYQFKIPVHQPDNVIGQINGFKSIRFMRIFLKNFQDSIILRMGKLSLVRDEWRLYEYNITDGGEGTIYPQPSGNGTMDISNVSIVESSQKTPVNYIMPPGVLRPANLFDQQLTKENEQSLSLIVRNLPDGQSKAIYKNVDMDFRKFKRLQMYVHFESLIDKEDLTHDYDLSLFVRIGSDFTDNYYEYEIPLKITPEGFYTSNEADTNEANRYIVWPTENKLDLSLQTLTDIKTQRNKLMAYPSSNIHYNSPYIENVGKNVIKILGNPNLANVKSIMIGIRNPRRENNHLTTDDGSAKSGEIWVNELRVADYVDDGGWAANTQINATLADFGNVAFSGYIHTPGFGSIEKRINERYTDQDIEYNISTQFQLGKFFKKDFGVSIPLYLGFSQSYSTPKYNPFDPDIEFTSALDYLPDSTKTWLKNAAQTFVQHKSINLTNISIQGKTKDNNGKPKKFVSPLKISNFAASIAYNEIFTRTPTIEYNIQQNLAYGLNYNYTPTAKIVEPFKKAKIFNAKVFQIIKDFNFYYLPTRFNFSMEVNRVYTTFKNRQLYSEDFQLPASYQKNFLWQRNYDFSYKITNNLRLDFTATNRSRVEPDGWNEKTSLFNKLNIKQPSDSIFLFLNDPGKNTDYNHNIKINYIVPINKLPLLRWTNLTANYIATYDWRRGQDSINVPATDTTPQYSLYFGNQVQNSYTLNLDGRLNFTTLYRSIKFLKNIDSRFTRNGRKPLENKTKEEVYTTKLSVFKSTPLTVVHNLKSEVVTKVEVFAEDSSKLKNIKFETLGPNKIKITTDTTLKNVTVKVTAKRQIPENPLIVVSDYFFKSLMMLKSVSVTYKTNAGSLINGYLPESKILGGEEIASIFAPDWQYLGGYSNFSILNEFAQNGWITKDSLFNLPMTFTNNQEIRGRISLEPLNNVKLDLSFQRSLSTNNSVYGHSNGNKFDVNTRTMNGNFILSINSIASAFDPTVPGADSTYPSPFYTKFIEYRPIIAQRLAQQRNTLNPAYDNNLTHIDSSGVAYPLGYSQTSQEVLTGAFLAAYTGISPDKIWLDFFPYIPIPDWRISFEGLSNMGLFKKFTEKITISHSYSSNYAINNFSSNPNFDFNNFDKFGYSSVVYETNNNFIPQYEESGILISEKFIPFIGVDIKWKGTLSTRFEYKRSRDIFLSFSNNQIRQQSNNGLTIGAGYTLKDLAFNINIDGQTQNIKSDLNLRLDITSNNTNEIYRKIIEQINIPNTSQKSMDITFTADYSINNSLSIQFYFNDNFMQTNGTPLITNSKGGFKVRYSLR